MLGRINVLQSKLLPMKQHGQLHIPHRGIFLRLPVKCVEKTNKLQPILLTKVIAQDTRCYLIMSRLPWKVLFLLEESPDKFFTFFKPGARYATHCHGHIPFCLSYFLNYFCRFLSDDSLVSSGENHTISHPSLCKKNLRTNPQQCFHSGCAFSCGLFVFVCFLTCFPSARSGRKWTSASIPTAEQRSC